MFTDLEFVRQYEKYSIVIKGFHQEGEQKLEIFLDFPVVMQDISGAEKNFGMTALRRRGMDMKLWCLPKIYMAISMK